MPRTKKSVFALTSAFMLFNAWAANLFKEVKELGGNEQLIYNFFAKRSNIKELAQSIIGSAEKVVKKLFPGNEYLKLISGEKEITIDVCDGTELISEATDTFASIDSDFRNYDANEKGGPTEATNVGVYELIKDSQFIDFFNSVGVSLDKLCLTHHQIKKFINSHWNWLRTDGYATFFLFKSKGKFFVAFVYIRDDGALSVNVHRLERGGVWGAGDRRRVVLPQLDTL